MADIIFPTAPHDPGAAAPVPPELPKKVEEKPKPTPTKPVKPEGK